MAQFVMRRFRLENTNKSFFPKVRDESKGVERGRGSQGYKEKKFKKCVQRGAKIMPRRGGGEIALGGISRAQTKIILPPLTNFSSTPLDES